MKKATPQPIIPSSVMSLLYTEALMTSFTEMS